MIVVVCSDALATVVTEVIQNAAHTGNKGDGIIMVSEVTEVIRIRTGEKRDSAL